MRALIYGGRDWDNQKLLDSELDKLHAEHGFTVVINGGQTSREGFRLFGADWQAAVWAQKNHLPIIYFHANWTLDGKAAGPIRNARMLREGRPDIAVEFPGGRGTRDMRRRLLAAAVPVRLAGLACGVALDEGAAA